MSTGDTNDYTFSSNPNPISLIWAYGSTANSYTLSYHGGRGVTSANFTLGNNDFVLSEFMMYPNPAKDYVTIDLSDLTSNATVFIYDYLGRLVKKELLNTTSSRLETSNLQKGTYIVKVDSDNGLASKILIVD